MKNEKRLQRRQRLMENKVYQTMQRLSRYMDRYYLDALACLAVSDCPHDPTTAHSSDDMGSYQFRHLPVFIGSVNGPS